ncbi:tetratricopeptide repeat protein [Terricaulis sp.]|uniref:tetratricopeptide repeat protein n=1 Tax=Terricaulis sp. TaxID=2768686 RepID=UPI003784D635
MGAAEIVVRHAEADSDRAALLVHALQAFGYTVAASAAPAPDHTGPQIFLWSPAAVRDEALIWDAAHHVRAGRDGIDHVYEAVIAPVRSVIKLRYAFSGGNTSRLGRPSDLTRWKGAANNDALATLIWELPPPASPATAPPFFRPADRNEAAWRAAVASGDIVQLARHIEWALPAIGGRRDKEPPADETALIRSWGGDAERWRGFGQSLYAAAKQGPGALHAWAMQVREENRLPEDCPCRDKFALLLAIQISLGAEFSPVTSRDHRSNAELLAAIARGDDRAWQALRHMPAENQKDVPAALERLAAQGVAAAQCALGEDWRRPEHERRLWLEKAAAQGHGMAFYFLGQRFQRDQWRRKRSVEYWRKGADVGDISCKRNLAEALDEGKGVKRDAKQAFRLYAEVYASEGGCELSERMAQMRWDGDGLPRDRAAAIQLLFKSHIVDHSGFADIFIGDMYRDGLGGLARDRAEAVAWYQTALYASHDVLQVLARQRLKALKVKPEKEDEEDLDPEDEQALRAEAKAVWSPRD